MTKLSIRCYQCGHTALVGVPEGAPIPHFHCGGCLDPSPIVEEVNVAKRN